ncbi:MAG: hypothetical protein GY940_20095, partial [bacterium]|nr:hypothetical protein [bacterium]
MNPNMVRLHDFDRHKDRTAWNYCGTPPITDTYSGFHLSGGLSRLNQVLAGKWLDYLFIRTTVHNSAHVKAVLINFLDSYPVPRDSGKAAANAAAVNYGLELLQKAREDNGLRKDVLKELGHITAGNHYRKVVRYLTGDAEKHPLFFSELMQLGARFLGSHQVGSIYYNTFGNLGPIPFRLFPQEPAIFFEPGWVSEIG